MSKTIELAEKYARISDLILDRIINHPLKDELIFDIEGNIGFTLQEIFLEVKKSNSGISKNDLEGYLDLLTKESLIQTHTSPNEETKYSITALGQVLHFNGGKSGELELVKSIKMSNRLTIIIAFLSAIGTIGSAIVAYCSLIK